MKTVNVTFFDCCRLAIPALVICGCKTTTGIQKSSLSFPVSYTILVNRTPSASTPKLDNTLKYNDMLEKGYAYIGNIACEGGTRKVSESKFKSQLLKESQRLGAGVTWLNTYVGYKYESRFSSGGTYTSYSPSSSSYMKYGTPATTTTVTYRPSSTTKKYKFVYGSADLFFYDPVFAAKQLSEAKSNWKERVNAINTRRPVLISKLKKLEEKLFALRHNVQHQSIQNFLSDYEYKLQGSIGNFNTGKVYENSGKTKMFTATDYSSAEIYFWYLNELTKENGIIFKNLTVTERKELITLCSDIKQYAISNWFVVCDFKTPTLQEQLLFK